MTDFQSRLQSLLGDRYRVQRELDGAGMSRVYVAEEARPARTVVIKVLSTSATQGLDAGRFEREIQVAGSLHHPHIVQLLATGEGDGMLWYAMPFVEGESLADRLRRGPLEISDVVRLLHDVADALAYAHARGIVHRDIKPANIMITGRHAMVTDFGIARALGSGLRTDATLTSIGMALGTPSYMAPEQAAADPLVDHRADIYALGIVAYEALTGGSPYQASTPQAILAAHVMQQPQPITNRRGDVPPDLAAIVMRCLAKSPDDRFAQATDLIAALEKVGTAGASDPTTVHANAERAYRNWQPLRVVLLHTLVAVSATAIAFGLSRALGLVDWFWRGIGVVMLAGFPALMIASRNERRRAQATLTGARAADRKSELTGRKAIRHGAEATASVIVIAAGIALAGVMGFGPASTLVTRGELATHTGLVLADFRVANSDTTLGNAINEALRVDLSQSDAVHLIPKPDVADALQRMGKAPTSRLDDSLARDVALRTNAGAIVAGEIHQLGGGFVLTASVINASNGVPLSQLRETASNDRELIAAVNRLSRSLRQKIGESLKSIRRSEPLEQVTTASLPALRVYSSAERAFLADHMEQARDDLLQAIGIDSTFAMAWRKLAITYANIGARAASTDAARKAFALRDRLPPLERHLTEGTYYLYVVHNVAAARVAFQQVIDVQPDDATALNNLALAEEQLGHYEQAELATRHCMETNRLSYNCFINNVTELATLGRRAARDSVPLLWLRRTGDSVSKCADDSSDRCGQCARPSGRR